MCVVCVYLYRDMLHLLEDTVISHNIAYIPIRLYSLFFSRPRAASLLYLVSYGGTVCRFQETPLCYSHIVWQRLRAPYSLSFYVLFRNVANY